ncbi:hypothetical protein M440DRAFT_1075314 [Trichoderma longibrachiatum ATCC 18648]|uniref:Uncharacterized protein n=1 Tax=Trichoderma longibrachiatum ATCC 18648 TaxID=983965 RepID=A0A2T4BVC2_TRILO|nr:hypothetical protein M440DRAFT_1075314 [Trichoderma longibrachiatum ATCC 18648]
MTCDRQLLRTSVIINFRWLTVHLLFNLLPIVPTFCACQATASLFDSAATTGLVRYVLAASNLPKSPIRHS